MTNTGNVRGWDGAAIEPMRPGRLARVTVTGAVSVAYPDEVPLSHCQVLWPLALPCGEPATVVMQVACPRPQGCRLVVLQACTGCCVDLQQLDECPMCGADAPGFGITALPGVGQ